MLYHKTVDDILSILKKEKMWFETFVHKPVRTSRQAAEIRTGYLLKQGAKAIIIKFKREKNGRLEFAMLVFPADLKFDNRKVKTAIKAGNFSFAGEDEIALLTGGVEPGGIPPFGSLFGLKTFCDKKLFANDKIIFNAGDKRFSVAMKSADYKKAADLLVADITC